MVSRRGSDAPQVIVHIGIDPGEPLRILRQVGNPVDFEPVQKELANLATGTWISQHAFRLASHLLGVAELPFPRSAQQLGVRHRVP